MFGQAIVAVDESGGGRDAIALAQRLVAPDGKLTLAHVLTTPARAQLAWDSASEPAERPRSVEEHERADELLRRARDEGGIASGRSEISLETVWSPSVGRGLHELAESVGTDLLVLGSSRRGLLGRVLLRDHTRAALNGAPCAVAVAPAGYADHFGGIRRIGVGYDGSFESEQALEMARRLAAAHHAELSACTAVSVPLPTIGPGPLPITDVIEPLLHKARERIAGLGGVAALAGYGPPVEVLSSYSESVDLLVVGSRCYGAIGRLVHGSTSGELARSARSALLVLPRSSRGVPRSDDANERRSAAADRVGEAVGVAPGLGHRLRQASGEPLWRLSAPVARHIDPERGALSGG
jgi:nucleotide-binding universal stress UspA family protein